MTANMRKRILAAALAFILMLCGCGVETPYRVETVVWIPMNPTEVPVLQPEQIEMQPEREFSEETEPKTETAKKPSSTGSFSGGNVSNGGKPSSGKNNSSDKSNTESKQTEPKETATEPPATEPPTTEPEAQGYDISGYAVGSLEYAIRDQINAARAENSLPELGLDGRLCAIAGCRAYELPLLWSHTRPDGRGYATVLEDYGYGAAAVTELLVYGSGSGDAGQMVSQWLASESHRKSLVSEGFTTVGVGVFRVNGITYVCCLLVG